MLAGGQPVEIRLGAPDLVGVFHLGQCLRGRDESKGIRDNAQLIDVGPDGFVLTLEAPGQRLVISSKTRVCDTGPQRAQGMRITATSIAS